MQQLPTPPPARISKPLRLCALALESGGGGCNQWHAADARTRAMVAFGASHVPALAIGYATTSPEAPASRWRETATKGGGGLQGERVQVAAALCARHRAPPCLACRQRGVKHCC